MNISIIEIAELISALAAFTTISLVDKSSTGQCLLALPGFCFENTYCNMAEFLIE